MKVLTDSCLSLALGVLLFAGPVDAATTKKPIKPVTKIAAPVIEPQPDPVTLIAQAHDAQSRGNTELAVRLAQSAIVADPARPSAYDALGDVYAASNQPDAARSYYGEALSIDPSDAAAQKAMTALGRGPGQQAAKAADSEQKTGSCGPACVLTTPQ